MRCTKRIILGVLLLMPTLVMADDLVKMPATLVNGVLTVPATNVPVLGIPLDFVSYGCTISVPCTAIVPTVPRGVFAPGGISGLSTWSSVNAGDIVMQNGNLMRWMDTSPGATNVNYIGLLAGSNNLELAIETGKSINFKWQDVTLGYMEDSNSGMGMLFYGVKSDDPPDPGVNGAILYTKLVGGKTALFVKFHTGAVQQIAIEP